MRRFPPIANESAVISTSYACLAAFFLVGVLCRNLFWYRNLWRKSPKSRYADYASYPAVWWDLRARELAPDPLPKRRTNTRGQLKASCAPSAVRRMKGFAFIGLAVIPDAEMWPFASEWMRMERMAKSQLLSFWQRPNPGAATRSGGVVTRLWLGRAAFLDSLRLLADRRTMNCCKFASLRDFDLALCP